MQSFQSRLARAREDYAAIVACNGDVDALNRYYASRRTPAQQAACDRTMSALRLIGNVVKWPLAIALVLCAMALVLLLNVGAWMIHPVLGFIVTVLTMARIAAGE